MVDAKVRSARLLQPRPLLLKFCSNGTLRGDRGKQKTHGSAQFRTSCLCKHAKASSKYGGVTYSGYRLRINKAVTTVTFPLF